MGIDWSGSLVPWILLALFTVGPVAAYLLNRPNVALGLLFVAGSFSAITVPIGDSNLRLEMIAVPAVAFLVVWREQATAIAFIRALKLPIALVSVYLVANAMSSVLMAPEPAESSKIVVWLALSITAAMVAGTVTWGRGGLIDLGPWIIAGAVIQVMVAFAAVASQAVLDTSWGVMSRDVLLGKASGLSWEANILSINIAMALPFLIWRTGHWKLGPIPRIALLIFLSVGLGLASSRGGIAAFAAAAGCVLILSFAVHWKSTRRPRFPNVLKSSAHVTAVLVIAIGTMQLLSVGGELIASARHVVVIPNDPASSPRPDPEVEPEVVDAYRYVGTGDTIALRWRHMMTAIAEVPKSPIIGLGTDSYPQRNIEPSCACPAFINNLTVATLYESGAVGLLGLAGLLLSVLVIAWRTRTWAYLAAVVAMVVGYQFTDAIRFESNWILIGVILGFARRIDRPD